MYIINKINVHGVSSMVGFSDRPTDKQALKSRWIDIYLSPCPKWGIIKINLQIIP